MNDWKKVFDLEILARQARNNPTKHDEYIAAANPAVVLWLIAELRQLDLALSTMGIDLHVARRQAQKMAKNNMELHARLCKLEKEADWLAGRAANPGGSIRYDCPQKNNPDRMIPFHKCVACWRGIARNAVAKQRGTNNE